MSLPWSVVVFGDWKRAFEISVVHDSFDHGKKSWGWHGPAKKLISQHMHNASGVTEEIWNGLLELAQKTAANLNSRGETP